jgi:hypothetical protein
VTHQIPECLNCSDLVILQVLFTIQMFHTLGDQWAGSLLGFLSLACCVIPYVFYYKGAAIRRLSHYAYAGDEESDTKGVQ